MQLLVFELEQQAKLKLEQAEQEASQVLGQPMEQLELILLEQQALKLELPGLPSWNSIPKIQKQEAELAQEQVLNRSYA